MKVFPNYFLVLAILLILVMPALLTNANGQTKSLSGKYINSEVGFEMVFPSGWNTNNQTSTGMLAVHGDPEIDWDESIEITISKLDGTTSSAHTLSPNLIPDGCSKTSEVQLSITGVSGFEAVIECGTVPIKEKAKIVGIFTNSASITMLYDADNYESSVADFDIIVKSFKLTNNDNVKSGGTVNQDNTKIVVPVNNTSPSAINNTSAIALNNTDVNKKKDIPSWIKNNAKWWSEGSIGDNDFVQGIQYLIKEGIMKIPETHSGTGSSQKIPSWIKNNAKWWSEGSIGDNDFVQGIQYLITHGIMKV